ncbi:hypothetical protein H6775_00255 [Candidatus Nomurabacteria bacterium]|nr:hypothetical protein [Candidatus Nomurabacteria bacterium]
MLNFKRGSKRTFWVVSICWIAFWIYLISQADPDSRFMPYAIILAFIPVASLNWIIKGF